MVRLSLLHALTVSLTLLALATAFQLTEQFPQAIEFYKRVMELKLPEELSQELQEPARSALKDIVHEQEATTEVVEMAEACLSEPSYAEHSEKLASLGEQFHAATLYLQQNQPANAVRTFEEIINVIELVKGEAHPDLSPVLEQMADAYMKMGLIEKANAAVERARHIASQ